MKGKYLLAGFLFLMLVGFVSSCDYYLDSCKQDGWIDSSTYCFSEDIVAEKLDGAEYFSCFYLGNTNDVEIDLRGYSLINGDGENNLGTGIKIKDSRGAYLGGSEGKVEGFESKGIDVLMVDDLTITDLKIHGSGIYGLELDNVTNFNIELVSILNGAGGVLVYDSIDGEINVDRIDCNKGNFYGVEMKDVKNIYLGHTDIEDCNQGGIFVRNGDFNEIESNGLESNLGGGITIIGDSNRIVENEFQDNNVFDIKVEGCLNVLEHNENKGDDLEVILSEDECVSVVSCSDLGNCVLNKDEGILWDGSSIVYSGYLSLDINGEEITNLGEGECLVFTNLDDEIYDESLCVKEITPYSITFSIAEPEENVLECLSNNDLEDSCLKLGEQMSYKGILISFITGDDLKIGEEINTNLEEDLCFSLSGLEEAVCIKKLSEDFIILYKYFPETVIHYPTNVTTTNQTQTNLTNENKGMCVGCSLDDNCYQIGHRKSGNYCSEEDFVEQKKGDESCENNFECVSNSCLDSKCIEAGFWTKFANWFRKLFS